MADIRFHVAQLFNFLSIGITTSLWRFLRFSLVILLTLTAPIATASSNNGVSLICEGVPIHVSVELYYLPAGGAGFGIIRKPDLQLGQELKDCSLDELYQHLLIRPEVVLNHSIGNGSVTALTQLHNATTWDKVLDFRAVKLQDGMRVWITLFDVPELKLLQEDA